MNVISIPKIFIIIIGILGVAAGLFILVFQSISMFTDFESYYYAFPNTLSGTAQEMAILFTNIWLALSGMISGLLFMFPVKLGRSFRVAGYTVPNEEVVPKSYRFGGIYMIVAGILSLIARFFFSPAGEELTFLVLILPIIMIVLGIIGLLAGLKKPVAAAAREN